MDYDEKVCQILEDLDNYVFDSISSSRSETEDNEDSLMDEAVLPCLPINKDASNIIDLDSQKNGGAEQNVDIKIETLSNQPLDCQSLYNKEDVLNQSDDENLSLKQTEKNFQYERSNTFEKMRCKSERIDVLVILENDRRKVVNMKINSEVKHLRKKFLKIMHKDALYSNKIDKGSEIIFQTYHDKFEAWVDAEQDLVLTDGMNLKVIPVSCKTQKEKESKRSYTEANLENHDSVKSYSKCKSKKLKSCVSRYEKTWSKSQSSSWLERSKSPSSRLLRSIQSYTYYERRDQKNERSEKAWRTPEYNCESGRGNLRKSCIDDYNRGSKTYNGDHQMSTMSYNKNSSYQPVNKTQSYSEELNSFLKMIEKQKIEKNETSANKVDKEELLENNSQNEEEEEEEEEGELTCTTTDIQQSTINEVPCKKVAPYILLSQKEIEQYSARLRINEKHPVQAVQEICTSVYKKSPLFETHEERCPLTKLMRYKYTLNVLGNIFTPENMQFNKKAAKVDAAILFLKHVGFK